MSMVKLVAPGAQQFGDGVARLVKVGGRGLRGNDLADFVKRAGHQFVDHLRQVPLADGEVPIHLLAIGATEFYGPNRNGDGFKEATCRKYHPTFVTKPLTKEGAYWYRNHQNKDYRKSYGVVKLAAYNERMRRIELLVALNGTKAAADRNGGLVADRELEKLARGESDWGVSMACRVPFDVCSGCGNRARHRGEYCTAATCKYGGLAENITKVAGDGHVLHADNPDPTFFDISDVYRPADRIAYVLGQVKAAGAAGVAGGAALAEACGVTAPPAVLAAGLTAATAGQLKLAFDLAAAEARGPLPSAADLAFHPAVTPPAGAEAFAKTAADRAAALSAAADRRVLLPVRDFLSLLSGESAEKTAALAARVAARLPGVFGRLTASPTLEEDLAGNPYLADRPAGPAARRWAEKCAAAHSVAPQAVAARVTAAAVRGLAAPAPRGPGGADAPAEKFARQYALYKLAFLARWAGTVEAPLLSELAVRQNYAQR